MGSLHYIHVAFIRAFTARPTLPSIARSLPKSRTFSIAPPKSSTIDSVHSSELRNCVFVTFSRSPFCASTSCYFCSFPVQRSMGLAVLSN
ncbi:unnamed protein product [Haemonchus placei]|uniref:Secreted protein n=1 Tax=Haemonchus placei TaxID=6290 RepID=A0A0N4WJ94_HAEPC|nr:unnamed protein product [Haemonchus placei]